MAGGRGISDSPTVVYHCSLTVFDLVHKNDLASFLLSHPQVLSRFSAEFFPLQVSTGLYCLWGFKPGRFSLGRKCPILLYGGQQKLFVHVYVCDREFTTI